MQKLILFLTVIFLNCFAQAERIDLCRRWYSYDVFQTYLRLYVDPNESLIIMDRHIPYGIRPFGYKITKAVCDKNKTKLQIFSKTDFNEEFFFSFQSQGDATTQSGTLTYLDPAGLPVASQVYECSQEAVKKLCLEL